MEVNSDDTMSLFLSSFSEKKDIEIVSIFSAWMMHGWKEEESEIFDFVRNTFLPTPTSYITEYPHSSFYKSSNFSLFKILTLPYLDNFLKRLHDVILKYGDLESAFFCAQKKRDVFAHETLARLFCGNTGFQSKHTNGTFYRYNLFLYWMTYKLKIWHLLIKNALLPCDDFVFQKAYELGITNKVLKSNLPQTIALTEKAKKMFGEQNFYKLYEIIKYKKE